MSDEPDILAVPDGAKATGVHGVRDDGGPIFPGTRHEIVDVMVPDPSVTGLTRPAKQVVDVTYPGMSLRDYFAGQALAGLLAHPTATIVTVNEEDAAYVAHAAGMYADAMLAARSKQDPKL